MDKLKIKVILGSTRENRFGERPAKWILEKAKMVEDFDVEMLDLRDFNIPFYDSPLSPKFDGYKLPNEAAEKWASKIAEADGYIIVTPEYNHGYSAVLKNAIDHLYYEWNKKPLSFVSYGSVGGSRAVEQLRLVAAELQMVTTRDSVLIPDPWLIPAEDNSFEKYNKSADAMLEQLLWWSKTLKAGRSQ
jgi:NAD(P)H-dependent FMN reductase